MKLEISARGVAATATVVLETEECCVCGVTFAMPQELRAQLLRRHDRSFWCPNGHTQHFTGETAEQRLRNQLQRAQDELSYAEAQARRLTERVEAEKRHHRATKGQLTKVKKRIGAGVCPCCHRNFVALGEHIRRQHPDFVGSDAMAD